MTGRRRSSWSPGGWVPPALGDLNRLVVSVESGLHVDCLMHLTVYADRVCVHLEHTCGLLPEVTVMS